LAGVKIGAILPTCLSNLSLIDALLMMRVFSDEAFKSD
jgi:hypothetical protein